MISRRVCFFALFLCLAASLFGFGKKEPDTSQESATQIVQVTGVVRLVGNAPFSELVIASADAQWYLVGDEAAKLKDLQHRTVTVEGAETVTELKFASGRPAGIRRELRDIRIIDIEIGGID